MFVALYAFLQSIIAKIVIALFGTTLVGIGAAVYACGQSGAAHISFCSCQFLSVLFGFVLALGFLLIHIDWH